LSRLPGLAGIMEKDRFGNESVFFHPVSTVEHIRPVFTAGKQNDANYRYGNPQYENSLHHTPPLP